MRRAQPIAFQSARNFTVTSPTASVELHTWGPPHRLFNPGPVAGTPPPVFSCELACPARCAQNHNVPAGGAMQANQPQPSTPLPSTKRNKPPYHVSARINTAWLAAVSCKPSGASHPRASHPRSTLFLVKYHYNCCIPIAPAGQCAQARASTVIQQCTINSLGG